MAAITAEACEENGLTATRADEITDAVQPAVVETGSTATAAFERYSEATSTILTCNCNSESACEADHNINNICTSPSGSDMDNIPQWKRDLIQRRKINIARTIGANQATICPKKASDAALIATSPVMPLTKTPTGSSSSSSSSNINTKSSTSQSQSTSIINPLVLSQQHSSNSGHYTPSNTSLQTQTPNASNTSQHNQSVIGTSSMCIAKPRSVCCLSSNQSGSTLGEMTGKCNCSSSTTSGTCLTTSQHAQNHQQPQPDSAELQQPFQLHSKHDIDKSSSSSSCSIVPGVSSVPSSSSSCSYIKNPSAIKACKNNKYKINSKSSVLTSASSQNISSTSSTKKMVASQDINETAKLDFDFDPSEELQYGPGIVSKLRCRYLSLALRQSAGKQRPPLDNLRRATSLNNLLDDDEDSNSSCVVDHGESQSQKGWNNTVANAASIRSPDEFVATFQKNLKISDGDKQRSRQIKRGNDSLKRARSVEALLGCDKSWDNENTTNGIFPISQTSKKIGSQKADDIGQTTDLSISSSAEVTIEDKITSARERMILNEKPPKRLTSIIDDTERPPPDLVKQTLKIFEATANRRGRGLSRNNFSGEVAAKVANYKSIISQEKPPITFPKPPLSPKKHFRKPVSLDIAAAKKTPPPTTTKITHPASPISNIAKKFATMDVNSDSGEKPLPQNLTPTTVGHRAEVAFRHSPKNDHTPTRNSFDGSIPRTPDVILRKHFEQSLSVDSPMTQLTKKIDRMSIDSPQANTSTPIQSLRQRQASESDDSTDGSDTLTKRVSKLALENISKAGTTQHFSFNKVSSKTPPLTSAINGNSSAAFSSGEQTPPIPTKQVGVIRPLVADSKFQTEKIKSEDIELSVDELSAKTRDNLVISNLSQSNTSNRASPQPQPIIEKPALTSREIEKNLINEKKNEQASLEAAHPKWQLGKKKSWSSQNQPQNNCMVFNFKDRKEVPDYIENDGLLFKRRRELPKPNESGFVLLGDLSLETSTDPDDSWTMGPPSPCDVEFENANIIIDGKSSMRYRSKEINLRVQFDDTLTSTFEYPSESSLLEDSISPDNIVTDAIEPPKVEEIIPVPGPKLLGSMSIGSAPLGSYTPVKAQIATNFELGVTRAPTPISTGAITENSIQNTNGNTSDCEMQQIDKYTQNGSELIQNGSSTEMESLTYLKPATDDLTVAYSEGTQKTDLLY